MTEKFQIFEVSLEAPEEQESLGTYDNFGKSKPIKTFDSFVKAAKLYPEAACVWLNILETGSRDNTFQLLQRIPDPRISAIAIEFAQNILNHNRDKLLKFREQL